MSLQNREVIVVGGSGGIGAEVSRLLWAEGAAVVVSYLANAERAQTLASIARIEQADLSLPDDRQRLLDGAQHLYGLVVMAGNPSRPVANEPVEDTLRRAFEANCLGPVLLAREAAARMRERRIPGSIVLLSTMQAAALFPGSSTYAASKAALVHAARILAKEMRGSSGIRVNVISPGIIDAGMAQASIAAGKYNRYLEDQTIARFGHPRDIARAVRFLLEPDNYITGQVLCIDGGITL